LNRSIARKQFLFVTIQVSKNRLSVLSKSPPPHQYSPKIPHASKDAATAAQPPFNHSVNSVNSVKKSVSSFKLWNPEKCQTTPK